MKLSECKLYDVVRIVEVCLLDGFKRDSINRREPTVGDVAVIVDRYSHPVTAFELECCDEAGVPLWLHAFGPDDLIVEPVS